MTVEDERQWRRAADDKARMTELQLTYQAMQECACLVYLGEHGSIPRHVPARVIKLHASQEVTFSITDPTWKAHLGWGPGAHVELQVGPHPKEWTVDHFCWQEVQGPPDWDF